MQRRSLHGDIFKTASWTLEAAGFERTVILGGYASREHGTLAEQTDDVLATLDARLGDYGLERGSICYWDVVCDPSVSDDDFRAVVIPALQRFFGGCDPLPAAGIVKYARLFGGKLIEMEMVAFA